MPLLDGLVVIASAWLTIGNCCVTCSLPRRDALDTLSVRTDIHLVPSKCEEYALEGRNSLPVEYVAEVTTVIDPFHGPRSPQASAPRPGSCCGSTAYRPFGTEPVLRIAFASLSIKICFSAMISHSQAASEPVLGGGAG